MSDPRLLSAEAQQLLQRFMEQKRGEAGSEAAAGQAAEAG